jgi:hypothetical protein
MSIHITGGQAFGYGGGAFPVYTDLNVDEDGNVDGEVHFLNEPQSPPRSRGTELSIHTQHPDDPYGFAGPVILHVKFVDDRGNVTGYAHGSRAQFHPKKADMTKYHYEEAIVTLICRGAVETRYSARARVRVAGQFANQGQAGEHLCSDVEILETEAPVGGPYEAHIIWRNGLEKRQVFVPAQAQKGSSMKAVFISHSSKDRLLADAIADLLQIALQLGDDQVRCTSTPGLGLDIGADVVRTLQQDINAARVVVGLVTPNSTASAFVMFELGAAWGLSLAKGTSLLALRAGIEFKDIPGSPLAVQHMPPITEDSLHQLVKQIAESLGVPVPNATNYNRKFATILTQVKAMESSSDKEEHTKNHYPSPKSSVS